MKVVDQIKEKEKYTAIIDKNVNGISWKVETLAMRRFKNVLD
jgi:hypothetical protein